MPSFAYRAVDAGGRRHRGSVEAPTSGAAAIQLERSGLLVLGLEPSDSPDSSVHGFAFGRSRAVVSATRSLASLLSAGLPLGRAFGAVEKVAKGELPGVLRAVRLRVERGDGVADALSGYPALFNPLYVGMVRAGERSGNLAAAYSRLAEHLEREAEFRSRLVSASLYPALLGVVGGGAVVLLMLFVLPRFADLLEGAGAQLPSSTMLLLAISDVARRAWVAVPLLLLGLLVAAVFWRSSRTGQQAFARLLLALPLIGPLRRQALAARFARVVAVLLAGGAQLYTALAHAEDATSDALVRSEIGRARESIREGATFNSALACGSLFPPLLIELVAVGEEAGQLEAFLVRGAEIFERETERIAERVATLIEPAMVVVFGGMVGFVALALLQAIYSVNAGSFR